MSKLIVSAAGGGIPAESLNTRRGFLRGLATLPLIGGAVAATVQPASIAEVDAAASPDAASETLPALLAQLLIASERDDAAYAELDAAEGRYLASHPSTRAALVLSAVGCDWSL